jgi:hypothetical protein
VLAIGFVDDAIVVVEVVERHIDEGMTPRSSHVVEGGRFALDTAADQLAQLARGFMSSGCDSQAAYLGGWRQPVRTKTDSWTNWGGTAHRKNESGASTEPQREGREGPKKIAYRTQSGIGMLVFSVSPQ